MRGHRETQEKTQTMFLPNLVGGDKIYPWDREQDSILYHCLYASLVSAELHGADSGEQDRI